MRAASETAPAGDRRGERISLADRLVSTALWGAGLSWLIPMLGSQTLLFQVIPSHKLDRLARIYCRGQVALTLAKWRAVVHPKVDPSTQYVFAQNHINHFDHVAMYDATPHVKQGLELETHFKYPFYGWFMKARGTVPVPADRANRTPVVREGMRRELEEGRSLLVFPEGTRTLDGRVAPFKTGIFFIARDLGVPIVPVAVTGMYDVMRKGSLILRPFKQVTVYCDEPVPTAGLTDDEIPALAERVRSVIAARVDAYFDEGVGRT